MTGHHISVVSIPVRDQNASRTFYEDVLGFQVLMDAPFGEAQRWVMLAPPGGGTAITLVTWFPTMPPGSLQGTVIAVPDIESAVAELVRHGAVSPDIAIESAPWGRFITMADPDGNGLVIQEGAARP